MARQVHRFPPLRHSERECYGPGSRPTRMIPPVRLTWICGYVDEVSVGDSHEILVVLLGMLLGLSAYLQERDGVEKT